MKAIEVKKGIYWVGAVDWSVRNFHGYTTNRGATYNAYLIIDEKITLIDTVKAPFAGELLARIRSVVDPEKIDYVVSNHVEMDHSGALPVIMKACPNAKVVTSAPSGIKGLTAHYGEYDYMPVKGGDTLSLGERSLAFVTTPMVHWPDNMVTYCPEEKILFSNDAFGQHYASNGRFDDQEPLDVVLQEAKKYYANIVMPYSKQAGGAVTACGGLDFEMICPSHGVIWRGHIKEILEAYGKWTSGATEEKALVVFDSMWHSTEQMALAVLEGFTQKGICAKLFDLKCCHNSDILTDVLDCTYIAVGSPTLNNQMLPTVASFLCYLKGLSPKNRKAFAFGSYGWGGQSIGLVEDELKACGFDICLDKIRIQYVPKEEQLLEITEKVKNL
ncbi:FprA family A-type flavoprotein [Cuneatibacter sp. NSJ-177]|uniref:FprA family A-type flavoprotein n=1 Tax=Cuneatibacter sp. NSJ-177 TaxID=2931401 RepID=UPI001FD59610|nr:FprA family A-type flavoprotein [Cuneatibacter sp. NSJ-177]MCJ7834910.1 FprA family A-type flavoprotein [Cuneatibacter sp. NSJ-177]